MDAVYVLHRRPYRETSLLLDVFSLARGRCTAIYRTNRKQPPLEPFRSYFLTFSGRGELPYATKAEATGLVSGLNGTALYCGFYVNELITRLTWKGEPLPRLFRLYEETLLHIQTAEHPEPVLRRFEFQMLNELGYRYSWNTDSDGKAIDSDRMYSFDPDQGFIRSVRDVQTFSGADIIAIANDEWHQEQSWKTAKQVARLAIQPLLGDKPLVSRSLFMQFRDQSQEN